jgi:hypothetical protein
MPGARIVMEVTGSTAMRDGTGSRPTPGGGLPFITAAGICTRVAAGFGHPTACGDRRGSFGGAKETGAAGHPYRRTPSLWAVSAGVSTGSRWR